MWSASLGIGKQALSCASGENKNEENEAMARYQNVNVLSYFTEKKNL